VNGTRLLAGRAFRDGRICETVVALRDGVIERVEEGTHPGAAAERFDGVLVPGFVDVHVHGGAGADFMDGDEDATRSILAHHVRHGTTALAATTLSASRDDLIGALRAIRRVADAAEPGIAAIAGVHLEGPYINAAFAGAQDRSSLRDPDAEELEALLEAVGPLPAIMTIAPELPGALELIRRFSGRITFSIGHTAADHATAVKALELGASHFTHLFNAMTPLHHREPGVVGAALASRTATAELIADGIHLAAPVIRIAVNGMPSRIALVTDAMRACGLKDGTYKLYDYDVRVADGAARLTDGTLAGSVLTMETAVRNAVVLAGLPLEAVIPLSTEVPARLLGLGARKGRIAAGCDADLVLLDDELRVARVFVAGVEAV
jgi:N-acetylglucosamine-6-phosphate deacetylase